MEAILGQVPLWGGRTTQATGAWGCLCMWQEQGGGWATVWSLRGQQKGHHQGQRQQPETQLSLLSTIPGGTVIFPSSAAAPWLALGLSWPFTVSLSTVRPLCQSAPHPASIWGEGAKVVPAQSWANPGQSIASQSLNFPTPPRKLLASWPS